MDTETRYKTLSNGAVYDMQIKRIVSGAVLTSEGARQLKNVDIQRKRDLLAAGALAAVEDQTSVSLYGSDAWLYEIGKAQAIKATTPDDPKSTDAARFMLKETGRGEAEAVQVDAGGSTVGRIGAVAVLLVRAGVVADVVDGTVTWEGGQGMDADGSGGDGGGGDG